MAMTLEVNFYERRIAPNADKATVVVVNGSNSLDPYFPPKV
jgi:hypothetical protein